MSDLFEENDEEMNEVVDDFDNEVEVNTELSEKPDSGLDARRRLELMLEEKRLRDELEDFDY